MARVNFDIAKRLDITTRKGDSFNLKLTLKDSSGSPINLFGADGESKFYMQVVDSDGRIILHTISNSTGGGSTSGSLDPNFMSQQLTVTLTDTVSTTEATGIVSISASAEDMKQVDSGRYLYDLQYEDPGNSIDSANERKTILFGTFTINNDITLVV